MEIIKNGEEVIAMILRASFTADGIKFFTPGNYSQQLAYMSHKTGHVIAPHVHNPIPREIMYTREVLFIKSGIVRVDLYSEEKNYLESHTLNAGDIILLATGGHGFEVVESAEIIEVKQGPYSGENDKTRFNPIPQKKLNIRS